MGSKSLQSERRCHVWSLGPGKDQWARRGRGRVEAKQRRAKLRSRDEGALYKETCIDLCIFRRVFQGGTESRLEGAEGGQEEAGEQWDAGKYCAKQHCWALGLDMERNGKCGRIIAWSGFGMEEYRRGKRQWVFPRLEEDGHKE